jgi:hypothetical protein
MVLWILTLVSIFFAVIIALPENRNFRGPFTLSLDCDGSEVVNCNSVVVDRYIVTFDMTDRCCFWKPVLCYFGLLGCFAWEAVELALGGCLHLLVRGPRPTDLGATIVVAPGQVPGEFLPSPDADCLPFLVKLVRVSGAKISRGIPANEWLMT